MGMVDQTHLKGHLHGLVPHNADKDINVISTFVIGAFTTCIVGVVRRKPIRLYHWNY